MEHSGGNILTKESRGAIITLKQKGFFSFCISFPRQMKNQYFARIRACPYHFPFRKVITLSKIFAGYRGCAPGPKKMISRKVKKTIYCVCSGNRIVPEPVSLRICGCRQQPGRKQRRKHHRTANRLNCYYRAGCRCMCRRRHQLCCV